jgi:hypothetical protein
MFLKLLMFILLIKLISSFKPSYFCILNQKIQNEVVCKKQQCGFDLCSIDKTSCKNLNNWYGQCINNKDHKLFLTNVTINKIEYFNKFLEEIKECNPNEYISFKKQVCSIKETCQFKQQYELSQLLKPFKLKFKVKPCGCFGKLKFKCGKYYCSDNKYTCNIILKSMIDSTHLSFINKC